MNSILKGVSIIIPTLNEASNLENIISKINYQLRKKNYEIIIVDDNSIDGSKEILQKLKGKKNFKYFIRKDSPDLNQACQLGFKKSKYNNIIVMDGDLQHDPKYLPRMINLFLLKNYDFLIATRNFYKEIINHPRVIFSIILIQIINLILGHKTSDPMSGFFLFKKSIYLRNKKKLYGHGFKILLDLLYVEKKILLVNEFEFKFNKRKKNVSKMNFKILYILLNMIFFYFRKRLQRFNE